MTIGVFVDDAASRSSSGPTRSPRTRASPGHRGYEFYVRLVEGGHVHAAAVAAAGRAPDADDRPEGQVHPRARRRPDAPVHLVRHRQRAVRLDDEGDAPRGPAAAGRLPQRRVVRRATSATASCSRAGSASGEYPVTYVPTVSRPSAPENAGWTGLDRPRRESIVAPVLRRARPDAGRTRSPTSAATRT